MRRSQTFKPKARRGRTAAVAVLSLSDDLAIAALTHGRWAAGRAAVLGPKGVVLGCTLGIMTGLGWVALERLRRRAPRAKHGPHAP